MREIILSTAEVACVAAIVVGIYMLLGLAPTLLLGGLVGLGACLLLELPAKKTETES